MASLGGEHRLLRQRGPAARRASNWARRPRLEELERYTLLSFLVTTSAASGSGSLAQAILDAESNGGGTIDFDLNGGGAQTISTSALPAITATITIDGTSQPGYSGTPLITIQGPGSGTGLTLDQSGGGSVVRGLVVTGFSTGITLNNAAQNSIDHNVISGNGGNGVLLTGSGATGNLIASNKIGTDASAMTAFPNAGYGVVLSSGAANNTVGGTSDSDTNVISGNGAGGVLLTDSGTSANTIACNILGADGMANMVLANGGNDVDILAGASGNTIGGTVGSSGNVISGSPNDGVAIGNAGTSGNIVEGNYIGLDMNGVTAIPNEEGVNVYGGATNNTIGGTAVPARNVISGNVDNGVDIHDSGTSGNVVEGNFIGTDSSGSRAIPNSGDGVLVVNLASRNEIGGTVPGSGNLIAFNRGNGVAVGQSTNELTTNIPVLGNAIFGNAQLGIDLADDGVSPNAPGGPHFGPNALQNYPVLNSATSGGGTTTVQGTLNSGPNTSYRIEFFANTAADPSGHGQGQRMLGVLNVTTDDNGNASFTANLSADVPAGQVVTATATDLSGNTSEFSADVTVGGSSGGSVPNRSSPPPAKPGSPPVVSDPPSHSAQIDAALARLDARRAQIQERRLELAARRAATLAAARARRQVHSRRVPVHHVAAHQVHIAKPAPRPVHIRSLRARFR